MVTKRPTYFLNLVNKYLEKSDKRNLKIGGLLKSFYYDCQIRNLTEKTIWGYGEALSKFFNFIEQKGIEFEDVTGSTIKEFIVSLKERRFSDHTINQRLRVLRLFFRYLVEEGMWDGRPNPMEKIKLLRAEKKLMKVLSSEEIERVLKVPNKKTFAGYRNFCIIYTFYDAMIRLSELTYIKLSDLNLKEQTIKVYGKGRKERTVCFGKKLAKYLQLYLYRFGDHIGGNHLFCKSDGSPLPSDQIRHIFARYSKKVKIHFTPHLLRHSAGREFASTDAVCLGFVLEAEAKDFHRILRTNELLAFLPHLPIPISTSGRGRKGVR